MPKLTSALPNNAHEKKNKKIFNYLILFSDISISFLTKDLGIALLSTAG